MFTDQVNFNRKKIVSPFMKQQNIEIPTIFCKMN